ncbi:hypothetical protein KBC61_02450 [Candidatus Babeliales bacterium]|nr:hypothetical protein [Candidatus Babeliales bacterium]
MNFLRKTSYSLPYKGMYGNRERKKLFRFMVIYFNIITLTRGNHYAYN